MRVERVYWVSIGPTGVLGTELYTTSEEAKRDARRRAEYHDEIESGDPSKWDMEWADMPWKQVVALGFGVRKVKAVLTYEKRKAK